jgi:hypothetical protein
MATYDEELLFAAGQLLLRRARQRGKLPTARIRRSVSTSYYALFHFMVEEAALRLVGANNNLRRRRRVLARTFSHSGMKKALDKVRGAKVDASVEELLRPAGSGSGAVASPAFAQAVARAFADAQAKRHDADYDLNKTLSEADARLLRARIRRVIKDWRGAKTPADKDFKHALCLLMLLKGQLRADV